MKRPHRWAGVFDQFRTLLLAGGPEMIYAASQGSGTLWDKPGACLAASNDILLVSAKRSSGHGGDGPAGGPEALDWNLFWMWPADLLSNQLYKSTLKLGRVYCAHRTNSSKICQIAQEAPGRRPGPWPQPKKKKQFKASLSFSL